MKILLVTCQRDILRDRLRQSSIKILRSKFNQ